MGILDLLGAASVAVMKTLIISAIGAFLALDRFQLLNDSARHHLNQVVFYVFNPSLVGGNLARTITFESFISLWFMPINILITFIIGSVLGWILVKITNPPKHLNGLIIGSCSAGNMGLFPIIIISAICKEKASPFGEAKVCEKYGLAYASLSLAIGAVYLWLYTYNLLRISAIEAGLIPSSVASTMDDQEPLLASTDNTLLKSSNPVSSVSVRVVGFFRCVSGKINLKPLLAPSTIAATIGFAVGSIAPIRRLLVGTDAPLHVVGDSVYMLGDAAIPALALIIGANLLKGLNGSGIKLRMVLGIVAVRYIVLPLMGIMIVTSAVNAGLVPSHDRLLVFILLLQYSLPPAMNLGTMTQLFGAGQSECSVIMLWTYGLASVAVTLWCTVFLWLVA